MDHLRKEEKKKAVRLRAKYISGQMRSWFMIRPDFRCIPGVSLDNKEKGSGIIQSDQPNCLKNRR